MAKSSTRSGQIPMLLPITRESLMIGKSQECSWAHICCSECSSPQSNRDALIERLRRDGFFELQKKK